MPKAIIFAGANGSGKTTFANETLESRLKYINADEIKTKEKLSSIKAGQKALSLIDRYISERINFSFETTMSGIGLAKRLEYLKKAKYHIIIFYLFVYPVELLIERIKERLKKGGHFVAEKDVIRRYYRSLNNFWSKYRIYSNEWSIVNNNKLEAISIVMGNQKEFQILDSVEFNVFKEVLKSG